MLFFDDQFPIHRKVSGLSDAAFRLHVSAIFWCARNLTDGVVPEEDLDDVCARVRTPARFVPELLKRGNWHEIGTECGSEDCPAHPNNAVSNTVTQGWVIHDYFQWQRSKERVLKDRANNAARQKKFRDQQKQGPRERNAVSNGGRNASVTRPSPVPSRRDGTSLGDGSTGDQSVRVHARAKQAARYLTERYPGLTDQEVIQIITQVEARSPAPIKHLLKYMSGMAEGDLADIVAAAMDAAEHTRRQPPDETRAGQTSKPPWCGECNQFTRLIGHDQPRRCPTCHPLRGEP